VSPTVEYVLGRYLHWVCSLSIGCEVGFFLTNAFCANGFLTEFYSILYYISFDYAKISCLIQFHYSSVKAAMGARYMQLNLPKIEPFLRKVVRYLL
jgi:hypothetical protein